MIWKTGKVESSESAGILYKGAPLHSNTQYQWQVRVWDNNGKVSAWSKPVSFHTGLFETSAWLAKWIEPIQSDDRAAYFRREFNLSKQVSEATLFITTHGIYASSINGSKVSEDLLTPGWTSYHKRLQYQSYDITSKLQKGMNAIGVIVAKGWYMSEIHNHRYGDNYGLLAQIMVRYKDGTQEIIKTDNSWRTSTAEVSYHHLYHGETIDLTKQQPGWDNIRFNDSRWDTVRIAEETGLNNLTASVSPAVRVIKTFVPKKYIITPNGDKVIDFGQNITGRERVRLRGKQGDTVRIFHAEVLDKNGEFYTKNLRSAKATSTYILSGEEEWIAPLFSFYGFRYIKVEGIKGDLNLNDFIAEAISSNIPQRGTFITSDSTINQLQSNIVWGMVDNYVDIPTDCPQRNERLGWTGDAQMFFRTATFNRDVQTFFNKWLADLQADQLENGGIMGCVPRVHDNRISAGWADAATIIPWQHYMAYGDTRILERQYASMKKWVDYISSVAENHLWSKGNSYGDWLYFNYADDRDGRSAVTIRPLIQQAFYAYSSGIVMRTAEILDRKEDAVRYKEVYQRATHAFCNEYLTPNGTLVSDTQTAYTIALMFDLLPEEIRPQAVKRLVENINRYGHITTGFIGTPYICHVLSRFGHVDLAYKLLLNRKIPSWIYPVTMGATTIWERWDSMLPDGSIPDNGMNSFNHYSYGAIGDWMYREIAGLKESSPGYRSMIVRPNLNSAFTEIKAEYHTPYGKAVSAWTKKEGMITMYIVIPVNTTADIYIPYKDADVIKESGKTLENRSDIKYYGETDGCIRVCVGSGTYKFTVN